VYPGGEAVIILIRQTSGRAEASAATIGVRAMPERQGARNRAMTQTIRVAMVRAVPARGEVEVNCRRLLEILDALAATGPDVVVTPECFTDGYLAAEPACSAEGLRPHALADESPWFAAFARWCREHRAWLVLGCSRVSGPDVFNSAVLFNREGSVIGTYDKVHLQAHDCKFRGGAGLPVFDGDFGKFGVMICADRRWPETARTLALRGARVIFNPTYGFYNDLNRCMMRTRAYENELFITFAHPRQSLVTAPDGSIVLDEEDGPSGFGVCEIDLRRSDEARQRVMGHLRDRVPPAYHRDADPG
jgi:predicted amidohydrolase